MKILIGICLIFICSVVNVSAHYGDQESMNGQNILTNYEVTKFYTSWDGIHILGYYTPIQGENLITDNHSYTLTLGNKSYADRNDYYMDMSAYDRKANYPSCAFNEVPNRQCNYTYSDVGFHFVIPFNDVTNQSFTSERLILYYHSNRYNITFDQEIMSALKPQSFIRGDYEIYFSNDLNSSMFYTDVDRNNAMVRTAPSLNASQLSLDGAKRYWDNSYYQNVYDISQTSQGNWYKVIVNPSSSKWVVEGTRADAWIHSMFIRMSGKQTRLISNQRPSISGDDIEIIQSNIIDPSYIWRQVVFKDREDDPVGSNKYSPTAIAMNAVTVSILDENNNDVGVNASRTPGIYTQVIQTKDSHNFQSYTFRRKIRVIKNDPPVIEAVNRYFSVADVVSNDVLMQGVTASDKQDGDVSKRVYVLNSNVVSHVEGSYKVTYEVKDEQGLVGNKEVNVYIGKDMDIVEYGYVRFIENEYRDSLKSNSKWRFLDYEKSILNESYINKVAKSKWNLNNEDLLAIQKFNDEHDFSKESNIAFLEQFKYLRRN